MTSAPELSTADIRQRFLQFFHDRGHEIVASSSLVPGNDPTLLFTNAGMVQFKDLFTGQEQRAYQRAVTSQRCVRAGGKHNDLDNVGYTARHHTFFEMLGNFSFGDYFKREAIAFAWQFLTVELCLSANRLWITVFEEDDEAAAIWTDDIGVPAERVIRIGAKDNFWMMGDTGPCGPCSEIFYDHGPEVAGGPPGSPDEDGDRYIEIWNLVFMQYERAADGTMSPLPSPCVDTGMGIERIAAVLQRVHSNYEIDLFQRLIASAAEVVGTRELDSPSLRVIADHIRSCAFLICDGVLPGNEGRGYVLRRIIRRAARHGHKLGATAPFFHRLTHALVAEMGTAYPELARAEAQIREQLLLEEERFNATLASGMKILDEAIADLLGPEGPGTDVQPGGGAEIPGEVVFKLYDTYGFPADLTADIARERHMSIDQDGFEAHMEAQRARARAASAFGAEHAGDVHSSRVTEFVGYTDQAADATVQELYLDGKPVQSLQSGQAGLVVLDRTPFYAESGGQVGDTGVLQATGGVFEVTDTRKSGQAWLHAGALSSGQLAVGDTLHAQIDTDRRQRIRQHHSATHLLHGALREILGPHVEQKGSLVNADYLRFDFSHTGPVNADQVRKVERWIDREVRLNNPCVTTEMSMDEARQAGAIALFGEKYGDRVRVVTLGARSMELCGGTHVASTGELGSVKLTLETGVASGIRRIEAVSGAASLAHMQELEARLSEVAAALKSNASDVLPKLQQLQSRNRELSRQIEQLQARLAARESSDLAGNATQVAGVSLLTAFVGDADAKALRTTLDQLRQQLGDRAAIVLASEHQGKGMLLASVSPSLHGSLKAGELMQWVAEPLGGRGGGRPDMAQGGVASLQGLDAALAAIPARIEQAMAG